MPSKDDKLMELEDLESEDEKIIEEMRIEFLKQKSESKKIKKFNSNFDNNDSISSDDCKEEKKIFQRLDYKSKEQFVIFLWHRSFIKGRAGSRVLSWANGIRQKILRFGITDKRLIREYEKEETIQWWILMPSGKFKYYWNLLMIFLLLYTATYMPYNTCFIEEQSQLGIYIDYFIDLMFFIDIMVTFISAEEMNDGSLRHNQKSILTAYIRGWFLFDFIAVFQSLLPFIITPELLAENT